MTGSDHDDCQDCPLCCTELDLTDRSIQYCSCGYHMCLWCYHHILEEAGKESSSARCPNCRSVYDQEKITVQHIDAEKLEEEKRRMKDKDKKPGAAELPKSRANLTNVRVVQPNLVYAVGLPLDICNEDLLRETEYFGQFGKVFKISVNRSNQYASALAKHGPTGSAYVTFKRPDDALRCIKLLDGSIWKGKPIKACFGTTKYCNAFLKGLTCNNPDCLYLHDLADEADCLTKEEVAAGLLPARFLAMGATNTFKPRLTINPIPNPATAAAQAAAAAAVAAGQPPAAVQAAAAAAGAVSRSASNIALQQRSPAVMIAPRIVLNDSSGSGAWGSPSMATLGSAAAGTSGPKSGLATWATISSAPAIVPTGPPPPPPTDDQEWPELGGAAGAAAASGQPAGAASPDRDDSSDPHRGTSLGMPGAQNGGTMAEQLARAHSNPPDKGGSGYGSSAASTPKPAKKLLPLSSPAKLKQLAKAPSASQRTVQAPAATESSSSGAAPAATAAADRPRTAPSPAAEADTNGAQPLPMVQQRRRASLDAAASEASQAGMPAPPPVHANGVLTAQAQPAEDAASEVAVDAGSSSSNKENWASQAGEPDQHAAQVGEVVPPKPRLAPPPGFAAPAANGLAAQLRPRKITPPPGFGAPISNVPTPLASNHTSIDSISQLGPDAEQARAGMRPAAAAPAGAALAAQPSGGLPGLEGYSPFSAFSTAAATAAAGGSLFSSLGSSGSLAERLPSTGDLLAATGGEAAAPSSMLAGNPSAAAPAAMGRRKSRFKFAQSESEEQAAALAAASQAMPPPPAHPAAGPYQSPPPSAAAACNPLHMLQQLPAQPPMQQHQQDAGAFFKSLFPGVNINVSSAVPARQPPPGFAHPPDMGGYGSNDGGSMQGLFGGPPGAHPSPPGPYPGTSPTSMYNPLAGMFASPQQQHHLAHHPHQQPQPAVGMGPSVGLSPGLALLRQLQGGSVMAQQQAQQQVAQQAAQQAHQAMQQQAAQQAMQQQAAQQAMHQQAAQHAMQQQQLQLGGGFVDPAIMAARPAAPPGLGNLGMSNGLGFDRPRPAMPPPGFGLQF